MRHDLPPPIPTQTPSVNIEARDWGWMVTATDHHGVTAGARSCLTLWGAERVARRMVLRLLRAQERERRNEAKARLLLDRMERWWSNETSRVIVSGSRDDAIPTPPSTPGGTPGPRR